MTQTLCIIQNETDNKSNLLRLEGLKQIKSRLQAWGDEGRTRRRLRRLLDCEDAILSDIGYTRAELQMALKLPRSKDARAKLKQWQQMRVKTG